MANEKQIKCFECGLVFPSMDKTGYDLINQGIDPLCNNCFKKYDPEYPENKNTPCGVNLDFNGSP